MKIESLINNFSDSSLVRHDNMEGRDHVVVPMIMMVEGVHAGSSGPLMYPAEELEKYVGVWNSKPVVLYHPEINGAGVSACDPDIFTSRKVGTIMNTRFEDGKLKAEAWIEKDRANEVDERIMDFIDNGKVMEVSTGLFTENKAEEGEFNGESYDAIATNYRPDHLALLPDKIGACSVEDGAGLMRLNEAQTSNLKNKIATVVNKLISDVTSKPAETVVDNSLSHNDLREALRSQTKSRFESKILDKWVWIQDVFDSFYVFEIGEDLFKLGYTMADGQVTIDEGEPVEVVRVTQYMNKSDGSIVANVGQKEEPAMDKEKVVDAIIANSAGMYVEADKEYLMGLEESRLEGMTDLTKNGIDTTMDAKTKTAQKKQKDEEDGKKKSAAVTKNQTPEEYIADAPEGIREVLHAGLTANANRRASLVGVITANEKNVFTAEQLNGMDLTQLESIAALAQNAEQAVPARQPLYTGAAAPITNSAVDQSEPLVMPSLFA